MSPLLALACLAASAAFSAEATLSRVRGASVNGRVVADAELDKFTWLLIQGNDPETLPPSRLDRGDTWSERDTKNLVEGALADMRRRHCATRLVADELERRRTPVRIVPTQDGNAETDFRTIKLNANKPGILSSVEAVGKLLYHEQLHILEKEMGLRDRPRGRDVFGSPQLPSRLAAGAPHYPENIPVVIGRLASAAGEPCPVSPEGQLLKADGLPLELILVEGHEVRRRYYDKLSLTDRQGEERALRAAHAAEQARTRKLVAEMCGPGKFDCGPDGR